MMLLIDVREHSEFNAGYIPGAVNIRRGTLEFKIGNEDFWDEASCYICLKKMRLLFIVKKVNEVFLLASTKKPGL